jgi:hypothetical protein
VNGPADSFGYRYLLPLRFRYQGRTAAGAEPFRYSFASLDSTDTPFHLVAGEYGGGDLSTRLAHYEVDPATFLLRTDSSGVARPSYLSPAAVPQMQGAVCVRGRYYLSTSASQYRRGSVWVGRPGALRRFRGALPPGPEDLAYDGRSDRLWSLTEHRGRRRVFAMDRAFFG